jgi:membrane protease YdiL (CAAX protease family)
MFAAFGVQVIVVLVLVGIEVSGGMQPQQLAENLPRRILHPPIFIGMLVLSQLAMGLSGLIPARLSPEPLLDRVGICRTRLSLWVYPLLMVGSLVPLALGIGAAHLVAQVIKPDETLLLLYEQMTTMWAIPFIILIGLAPGMMEELFFRGYVQRRLIKRWSPRKGILVTSIIFGLFHVTPHAIPMAFIMGLWLGWLAWRTGSIWPGVCCHAFVNSTWNVWQVGQRLWGLPEVPSVAVIIAGGLVFVSCFLVSVWLVNRMSSNSNQVSPSPI